MLQRQPPRPQAHDYPQLHTPSYFEREQPNVGIGSTYHSDTPSARVLLSYVTVFILALALLAGYFGYKASTEWALIAFFLIFGILGFAAWRFTVIVASGNFASSREIRRRWNAEEKKMRSAEAIYLQQLENQRLRDRRACMVFCEGLGFGDIHGLDGNDDDGLACESLPGGFKIVR